MQRILTEASALPDLQLDNYQQDQLLSWIKCLPQNCFDSRQAFHDALRYNIHPWLTEHYEPDQAMEIIYYLQAWFSLALRLVKFNRLCASQWLNVTNKPIVNDDLLPLTIALLPKKISLLRTCETKLLLASQLNTQHDIGFSFANLNSAITFMLMNFGDEKILSIVDDQNILIVANQLNQIEDEYLLAKFKSACIEYKHAILKEVSAALKCLDESTQAHYLCHTQEDTMTMIINDLNKCDHKELNKNIFGPLTEAYTHLTFDLLVTLDRMKHTPHRRLVEFSEKIRMMYVNYCRKEKDESNFFLSTFKNLFFTKEPTKEMCFFRSVIPLFKFIRIDDPIKKSTPKKSI